MILIDNQEQIQFVLDGEGAEIRINITTLCRVSHDNHQAIRVFGCVPDRSTLNLVPNQPTLVPWSNAFATLIPR